MGGRSWKLDYEIYKKLAQESEYASWLYVWGCCPNHFTVSINHLTKYQDIFDVNEMIKENGFTMNISGGEIKGSVSQGLEQSSIMSKEIEVKFSDGSYKVPGCYYEFAYRYNNFDGFITKSANHIFESTNEKSKD